MGPFDLIFVVCFLGAFFYGTWLVWLLVLRRWLDFRRHAIRLGSAIAIYLLVVVLAGTLMSRRELSPEAALRSDDWLLSVENASATNRIGSEGPQGEGQQFLVVRLKISSAARGIRQAAPKGSLVYLVDAHGTRWDVSPRGQSAWEAVHGPQPELTAKLDPNSSPETVRVFEPPRNADHLSLAHRHGSGFPGVFIIGEGFRSDPAIRLRF